MPPGARGGAQQEAGRAECAGRRQRTHEPGRAQPPWIPGVIRRYSSSVPGFQRSSGGAPILLPLSQMTGFHYLYG